MAALGVREGGVNRTIDLAERLLVALLSIPFLIAFARALPMHPNFILLAISETLAVGLVIIRKPGHMAITPYAFFVAVMGTALPLLIRPAGAAALLPSFSTTLIMSAGLALSIAAKLFLNRSFGIVAANRGVKNGGPYRLVRHPMYLGYMVNQLGFLLAAFSFANLCIYAVAWAFQILRIKEEERLLREDDAYLRFAGSVRFKLVPWLF